MKKIFFVASALVAALAFASCQKNDAQEGDLVTATFTIVAPHDVATKVIGDGQNAKNLVFAVYPYDLAPGADNTAAAELVNLRQGDWTQGQTEVVFNANLEATVTVSLVRGKAYQFVYWAQNKDASCFNFRAMNAIEVSYANAPAQDNNYRDAFYAHAVTSDSNGNPVKVTDGFNQTIVLRRPFAQINVGSTDMTAAEDAGLNLNNIYSSMNVSNIATVLNTLDGTVSGAQNVSFTRALAITNGTAASEKLTINDQNGVYQNTEFGWLAMNYVLVGLAPYNETHNITFSLYDGDSDAGLLYTHEKTGVTLKRNFRTHLIGDVLTAVGTINIVIEEEFYDYDIVETL